MTQVTIEWQDARVGSRVRRSGPAGNAVIRRYHRQMPIKSAALTTEVDLAAKLFRGLADSTRLAILLALQGGERRVVDLAGELRSSQANVSGHLSCLKDCGLVTDRPAGRANYYRLARPELVTMLRSAEQLLAAIGHDVDLCTNYTEPDEADRSAKESA